MSNNVLVNTDIKPGESVENTPSTLVAGTDGDFIHNLRCDADGILQVNLATPTISVTGLNASVGTIAGTAPVYATQVGGTDGTVLRELHFTPPSAAAPATDPALIVTFSPNSPLPAGSNVIGTVTANLGTSGDLALDATLTGGSQTSRLTDGTHEASIVTGSAGSGDTSLVVGLSPNSPLPAGTNDLGSVTANIGTTNGLALNSTLIDGSQHTKISNGGFDVAVKAGSTAAGAGDGALVVALSPNSPLPAGSNVLGSVTANVGTTNGLALDATLTGGTQQTKIVNGGLSVAVKGASTAVGASDNALAVGLSPNSPLPAGTNALGTVTAVQSSATSLNATVSQSTASNLRVQPEQPVAANLNATVVQGTAANLNATVVQATAASLNATVVQNTAANLNATVVQGTATNLKSQATQGPGAAATAPWSVELSDGTAFYVGAKTGQLPTALVGGRLDENVGAWMGSTAPTVGQKTMTSSLPVVIASNQSVIPVETEVQLDYNTSTGGDGGGGVQNLSVIGIALPSATGAVAGGTATNPLNVAGSVGITGTPTVSISGTPAVTVSNTPAVTISGTPAVTISGTPTVTASGTVTANQGTPAATANSWATKLTDGTNGPAAIETAGSDGASNTNNALSVKSRLVGYNGTTWDRVRAGVSAAASAVTGFLNVLPMARFDTTPATRTSGQSGMLQTDNIGNLLVSLDSSGVSDLTANVILVTQKPVVDATYSWTRFQNLGANATLNVKASAAQLFSAYMHNVSSGARYLQFFNTATVPSSGATPVFTFLVPAGGVLIMDGAFFGPNGVNFTTGLAFACSTTEKTYTAATASDHVTQIMYV
jgi:hypothetical protein